MAEKSAEIHTLAPRLSYVEDKLAWAVENIGSGDGEPGADPSEKLQKLWNGVLDGAYTSGWSTPWNAESIYESEGISLFHGLYGFDIQGALNCLDGEGFYGHVFAPGDVSWNFIVTPGARPLAADVFAGAEFVSTFRTQGTSLCQAIWYTDVAQIGSSRADTIIGKIEKLQQDLQDLRNDLNGLEAYVDTQVARLDQRINELS